jgi:hypothetical protein
MGVVVERFEVFLITLDPARGMEKVTLPAPVQRKLNSRKN